MKNRIDRGICGESADIVARRLLGCTLVRQVEAVRLAGVIVETEAYVGENDLGAHASRGRTDRTEVMYGPPGYAYVYFIYGMYYCLNMVAREIGVPHAVLVRAIEPTNGIERMRENRRNPRNGKHPRNIDIANGPGKLCAAMQIDHTFYGHDLVDGTSLWIESGDPVPDSDVAVGPRIGIAYAKEWAHAPLRFMVRGNSYVSR